MNEHKQPMQALSICTYMLELLFDVQARGLCTVFFSISGHCQLLRIAIHEPIWIFDVPATFEKEIYLDAESLSETSIDEYLEDFKIYIRSIEAKELKTLS